MTIESFLLSVLFVFIVAMVFIVTVFVCVKLGTYAFLRARFLFEKDRREQESKNQGEKNEKS